jgi:S1-C subfamily serine protease
LSFYDEDKVIDAIEKVSRCVVNVSTVKLYHDYFYTTLPVKGMRSGAIIDSTGYILTNNHVIEGAKEIMVTLTNGRTLQVALKGTCYAIDVALIKVDEKNLPTVEFGDSDKLRVGQRVFAVGNPFGLVGGPTVTSGVVSALNRSVRAEEGVIENLIQTDAAINPGNSGGPLIDIRGRVVGISTAIIPFAQGIGFAVPINSAKTCTNDIMVHGRVIRPWLGITGLNITREVATYYNLPVESGVIVTEVARGSPSEDAEIVPGEIILEVDGVVVGSVEDLLKEIHKKRAGRKTKLTVIHNAKKRIIEVTLAETP